MFGVSRFLGSNTAVRDAQNDLTIFTRHAPGTSDDQGFTYDRAGNRTGPGYATTTGNRQTQTPGFTHEYDQAGNLIKSTNTATGEARHLTYDARGRLTNAQNRTAQGEILSGSAYGYDPLDRRIKVSNNGGSPTWTRWDGDDIVSDHRAAGEVAYMTGAGTDQLLGRSGGGFGATDWYLTDAQGSVRRVIDSVEGSQEGSASYDATGNRSAGSSTNDRFGYTSRDWDGTVGLQYNRARYYDPELGRWTQEDPIGFAGGDMNLYRYVGNSPVNYTDPSGQIAFIPFMIYGGMSLLAGGTAGLHYANYERDQAFAAASDDSFIHYDAVDQRRTQRADYIGAASEAVAMTGGAMILTGAMANPAAFAAGWGMVQYPTATAAIGVTGTTAAVTLTVAEGYDISQRWDRLSGPERVREAGTFGGTALVGALSPFGAARDAALRKTVGTGMLYGALGGRPAPASAAWHLPAMRVSLDAPNRVLDPVEGTGRLGGHLYDTEKLGKLGRYLERRGVTLKVGDEFLPRNKAGGFAAFEDGTAELLLRSSPTEYEVWHELSHYVQWKKIGPDAYRGLPRWTPSKPIQDVPEQFVFDLLENSKDRRWYRLNFDEQQHAIDYIQRRGGFR